MIGRRCWSPSTPGRAVSRPQTGGGALAGGVTIPAVIPAEAGRWGVICWEWSRTAGTGFAAREDWERDRAQREGCWGRSSGRQSSPEAVLPLT